MWTKTKKKNTSAEAWNLGGFDHSFVRNLEDVGFFSNETPGGKKRQWPVDLGYLLYIYIGDYTTHIYILNIRLIVSNCKDPYEPISIIAYHEGFFERCSFDSRDLWVYGFWGVSKQD